MVPTDATIELQAVLLFVVEVDARHLRSRQALSACSPATATVGESHVVDVIGIAHKEEFHVVLHPSSEDAAAIAVACTCSQVGIQHDTFVHALLNAKVEHRLFLAVIHATDACLVALFVVGLDTFYDARRQVLQRRLRVTGHKLLAVDHDLLHLLAVDGDFAVIVNLCTR